MLAIHLILKARRWATPLLGGALAISACGAIAACGADSISLEKQPNQGAGGSNTTAGSGAGGGPPLSGTTVVGKACAADDACGTHPDSFCVTAADTQPIFTSFWGGDEIGGGVAGGYCTRSCGPDSACPTGSRCGGGICLALCEFGAPDLASYDEALSSDKCHGRDDLMCVPSSADDSVCMPNCGAGSDCEGRACDARFGVCTAPNRSGSLNGSACMADIAATEEDEDPCAGLCLELTDDNDVVTATMCTSRCSLGGAEADCGGPEIGICAIPRVEAGSGESQLGDEGFCATACEAHDGCAFDSSVFCFDLGNYASLGKGYCLAAKSCEAGTPCGPAQACTVTQAGKVCLDDDGTGAPLIPLGLAAP